LGERERKVVHFGFLANLLDLLKFLLGLFEGIICQFFKNVIWVEMKTNEKGTAVGITPHELALTKGHFLPSKQ
jgi:hypothetical protein